MTFDWNAVLGCDIGESRMKGECVLIFVVIKCGFVLTICTGRKDNSNVHVHLSITFGRRLKYLGLLLHERFGNSDLVSVLCRVGSKLVHVVLVASRHFTERLSWEFPWECFVEHINEVIK